ncbi:MAG: hypothetical protein ACLKAK_12730 [Alkaliphilus sp.]
MKKLAILVLVVVMTLGVAGSAFAVEDLDTNDIQQREEMQERVSNRFEAMKEFNDEHDKIRALRIETKHLQIERIEKAGIIYDLSIVAWDDEEIDKLRAAREIRKENIEINKTIRALHEQVRTKRKEFRESIKANDFATAQIHIDEVINLLDEINRHNNIKITNLDEIIAVLQ